MFMGKEAYFFWPVIAFSIAFLSFPVMSRPFLKHFLRVDILTSCFVSQKEAGFRISVLTVQF